RPGDLGGDHRQGGGQVAEQLLGHHRPRHPADAGGGGGRGGRGPGGGGRGGGGGGGGGPGGRGEVGGDQPVGPGADHVHVAGPGDQRLEEVGGRADEHEAGLPEPVGGAPDQADVQVGPHRAGVEDQRPGQPGQLGRRLPAGQ